MFSGCKSDRCGFIRLDIHMNLWKESTHAVRLRFVPDFVYAQYNHFPRQMNAFPHTDSGPHTMGRASKLANDYMPSLPSPSPSFQCIAPNHTPWTARASSATILCLHLRSPPPLIQSMTGVHAPWIARASSPTIPCARASSPAHPHCSDRFLFHTTPQ